MHSENKNSLISTMFSSGDLRTALRAVADIVPRTLAFTWEASSVFLSGAILILLVNALTPALVTWLSMKVLLDGIVDSLTDSSKFFIVAASLGTVVGLWLLNAMLTSTYEVVRRTLQQKTETLESVKLLEKSASLDIAFFESPKFYDLMQHAKDNRWLVHFTATQSFTFFQHLIGFVAMVSLLSVLHPIAILVLVVTALPSLLMQVYFAQERVQHLNDTVRDSRTSEYFHEVLTSRQAASEIRVFSLANHLIERFGRLREAQDVKFWMRERKILGADVLLSVLSLTGTAAIWIFAVVEASSSRMTVGDLALVFVASTQCRGQLETIVRSSGEILENVLLVSRFFEFLDLNPTSVEGTLLPPQENRRLHSKPLQIGLEIRDVSFSYPGAERLVFNSLSLSIPPRSKLAIVGENGAGKTTLVKLLTRLYDPTSGKVMLDGIDLRSYLLADVRSFFGVVFQDFVRYELTVAFGNVDALEDSGRIESVARRTGASRIIDGLPDGFRTALGKTYDEGVDLSGGEWQQLAIARALNSDAQVLILDEPTASLDALVEQRFYENFARLSENRTVVFISHRFSTVKIADTIVVLENGRIVESGSHKQLMDQAGKYAHMYRTQASRYVD